MARVFIYLSVANIILLIGTAMIGLLKWEPAPDRHIILAVLTLMLSSLLQVLTFTYFNVTGKMVTQAVHLSSADMAPIYEQKRVKYRFMWLMAMIVGCFLFSITTGATRWRTGDTGYEHLLSAGIMILVHLIVLMKEYSLILDNSVIVKKELQAYEHWRKLQDQEVATALDQDQAMPIDTAHS